MGGHSEAELDVARHIAFCMTYEKVVGRLGKELNISKISYSEE